MGIRSKGEAVGPPRHGSHVGRGRRRPPAPWLPALALPVLLLALAGCMSGGSAEDVPTAGPPASSPSAAEPVQLEARPSRDGGGSCAPGTRPLSLEGEGKALVRVTKGGGAKKALLLALHGAGGSPRDALWAFRGARGRPGVVILAPAAAGKSWNVPGEGSAGDVELIDRALRAVFQRCPIDPARIAVGGFSAGASYALSLGLANGDLFSEIMALSPGGIPTGARAGQPRIFVAHGRNDEVVPIERGGRPIVESLRDEGYSVNFRAFRGGHAVPLDVSRAAVSWYLGDTG